MVNRRLRRRKFARGFTLLEVMIALAVFATLAAAVLSASQYVVKQSIGLDERLLAAWLADNQLTELRVLRTAAKPGQQQQTVNMARRDWILRQHISLASDPRLLKVEVSISLLDSERLVYQTHGWIANRYE